MKEPITTFGLGILCLVLFITNIYQWQNSKAIKQENSDLNQRLLSQTELEEKEKTFQKTQAAAEKKWRQREKRQQKTIKLEEPQTTSEETFSLTERVDDNSESSSSAKKKEANRRKHPLAQLISSPEMKEMMRAQQDFMTEKNYGDFIKQTALSPQEKEKLMELIKQEQMQEFEVAQRLISGETANREKKNSVEDEIKTLLGENRYTQYKAYQKTIAERMVVNGFVDQMTSSDMPIQPYQKSQLTQILIEEYEHNRLNRMPQNEALGTMLESEKTSDDYFTKQRNLNERILLRAQTVLNPQQLQQLKQYQESMLAMQEASMKMLKSDSEKP